VVPVSFKTSGLLINLKRKNKEKSMNVSQRVPMSFIGKI